jgi:hypothetical protein
MIGSLGLQAKEMHLSESQRIINYQTTTYFRISSLLLFNKQNQPLSNTTPEHVNLTNVHLISETRKKLERKEGDDDAVHPGFSSPLFSTHRTCWFN